MKTLAGFETKMRRIEMRHRLRVRKMEVQHRWIWRFVWFIILAPVFVSFLAGCGVNKYLITDCSQGTAVTPRADGSYAVDECYRMGRKP